MTIKERVKKNILPISTVLLVVLILLAAASKESIAPCEMSPYMKEIPIPNLKFGMSRFDVLKVIKQNGLNYNNTSDVNLPDGSMVFNFDKGQGIKTRWNLVNVLSCIFSEGRLVGVILQKDYHSNLFRDSMADLIKGGYSERFGNSTYKLSNGIRMWSWRIIESADLTLMSASDEETHSTAISVSCVSSI